MNSEDCGGIGSGAGFPAIVSLLTANVIDEIGYYRALALELGLPFTQHGRVSTRARFPESVQAGLAPLRRSWARVSDRSARAALWWRS